VCLPPLIPLLDVNRCPFFCNSQRARNRETAREKEREKEKRRDRSNNCLVTAFLPLLSASPLSTFFPSSLQLKTKTSLPETELFILGRSLGSSVAVRLASEVDIKAKGPGSKGVILQSAYSSYKAAAGASMSMLGFVAASVWPTDMGPPTDFAPDIKSCVHQFHSEDDEWVPISQGRKVHKLIEYARPSGVGFRGFKGFRGFRGFRSF